MREHIEAAGIKECALFRTFKGKIGVMTDNRLVRQNCLHMIQRRAKNAGLQTPGVCNNTFRGTGITAYVANPDARLELAQQMATHSEPKTTTCH